METWQHRVVLHPSPRHVECILTVLTFLKSYLSDSAGLVRKKLMAKNSFIIE